MLREINWNLAESKQTKTKQSQSKEKGTLIVGKHMEFN